MDTGNSSDFSDTFINSATEEFAVEVWVDDKDLNYKQHCFVIFGLNGARIEKTLPKGFEYNTTEVGYAGEGSKAGYCCADNNKLHNSFIVYVK